MKYVRKLTKPVTQVTEIFCNKCGLSCRSAIPMDEFNGLIEAIVTGGYGSTHLEDGGVYKFTLCERCLVDLFKEFKTNPFQGNLMIPNVDNQAADFDPKAPGYASEEAEEAFFRQLEAEDAEYNEDVGEIGNFLADLEIEDLISTDVDLDDVMELPRPLRIKKEDLN